MDRTNYLIDFENIDWESPAPGIRFKARVRNNQRMRLVEFSEGFVEKDWCTKGHMGYVLEGSLTIDFNGKRLEFKCGDGIFICRGEGNKHKARIAKGKRALVVLFEEI